MLIWLMRFGPSSNTFTVNCGHVPYFTFWFHLRPANPRMIYSVISTCFVFLLSPFQLSLISKRVDMTIVQCSLYSCVHDIHAEHQVECDAENDAAQTTCCFCSFPLLVLWLTRNRAGGLHNRSWGIRAFYLAHKRAHREQDAASKQLQVSDHHQSVRYGLH